MIKNLLINIKSSPVQYILGYCKYIFYKLKKYKIAKPIYNNYSYFQGVNIVNPVNVSIGNNCSFGGKVQLQAYDKIEIGDNCMFAYGTVLATATHDLNMHPMNLSFIKKPISIGSNVWVGTNALILPGVIVGDNAVIGAGAVVTKDVDKNSVVAGVPAKIIKYKS